MKRVLFTVCLVCAVVACLVVLRGGNATDWVIPIGSYTVATLPAAGAANRVAFVTDGNGNSCTSGGGTTTVFCRDTGAAWQAIGNIAGSGGAIPSGSILLIDTGSCPTGFTEVSGLSGKFLLGTLAAAGDVGTTGGYDAITSSGTNSAPSFTGSSASTSSDSAGTPAGTNSAVNFSPAGTNSTVNFTPAGTNSTVPFTPAGTNSAPAFTGTPSTTVVNHVHVQSVGTASTGSLVGYTYDASTNTSVASGYSTANPTGGAASYTPAGTVAAPTFTGTQGTIPAQTFTGTQGTVPAQVFTGTQGTVPAQTFTGSPLAAHAHTLTAAGTVAAPVFTGTQFDNRPAFVKVIHCKKD